MAHSKNEKNNFWLFGRIRIHLFYTYTYRRFRSHKSLSDLSDRQFQRRIKQEIEKNIQISTFKTNSNLPLFQNNQINIHDISNDDKINTDNTSDNTNWYTVNYNSENAYENCSLETTCNSVHNIVTDLLTNNYSNIEVQKIVHDNSRTDKETNLKSELSAWATECNVPQLTLNKLLKLLRKYPSLEFLPRDSRTILGTPKQTIIKNVKPGQYWHCGLKLGITNFF